VASRTSVSPCAIANCALRCDSELFGATAHFRDGRSIQVRGSGPHDVLAFELDAEQAGRVAGISHFGFHPSGPADRDLALEEGSQIELWYE
jgi:hypothetical protein